MSRVTNAPASRERRKRRLDAAKGFSGSRSKLFRQATEAVNRAQRLQTIHRKHLKRDFRKLWIGRINTATRMNGMSYSRFIEGLTKANITLNRKMLSEIAIHDPQGFAALVARAQAQLAK
jgi:large subunit ribosomal protein L20